MEGLVNQSKRKGHWSLVNFSNHLDNDRVYSTLTNAGYGVNIVDEHDWLGLSSKYTKKPAILLLDNNSKSRKDIISILDELHWAPRLGVFGKDVDVIDNELAFKCDDFIEFPCSFAEFNARIERVLLPYASPSTENNDRIASEFAKLNLIGESAAFLEVLHAIKRLRCCDASVLINGDTGTGKELVARAIHYQSSRSEYPFIPVNCGAIPDSLFENELFGHVKGAYTDAAGSHMGLVEQAQKGTLFLDEVDSLSLKAQVALLRFMQDMEYRPLGGNHIKHADIRVVAATNSDLAANVMLGEFRSDLYYRLNILQIDLPCLQERRQDISLLANYFADKFSEHYGISRKKISPSTMKWMSEQKWPGNVRELENFIHRCCLSSDGFITLQDSVSDNDELQITERFFEHVDWNAQKGYSSAKSFVISEFEKNYLDWLMQKTKGNISDAARFSGKERRALGRLLKKHAIDKSKYLA